MDYAQQQRNPLKHLVGFSLVVLLHVVVVYALVNGLARKIVDVIKKPIETKIVEEHKQPPPPEAPPPPPPKLVIPPPPFIPPPEIQIAVAAPTNTITQVTNKTPPPPPPAIKPVQRAATAAAIDRGSCVSTDPAYPMASRRNQEVGTLVLRIEIDVNGSPGKVEVRVRAAIRAWTSRPRPGSPRANSSRRPSTASRSPVGPRRPIHSICGIKFFRRGNFRACSKEGVCFFANVGSPYWRR